MVLSTNCAGSDATSPSATQQGPERLLHYTRLGVTAKSMKNSIPRTCGRILGPSDQGAAGVRRSGPEASGGTAFRPSGGVLPGSPTATPRGPTVLALRLAALRMRTDLTQSPCPDAWPRTRTPRTCSKSRFRPGRRLVRPKPLGVTKHLTCGSFVKSSLNGV